MKLNPYIKEEQYLIMPCCMVGEKCKERVLLDEVWS